jgi:hypothetical protein
MHIMLDNETLDTTENAALIQIGGVPFELKSGGRVLNDKALDLSISLDGNLAYGRSVSGDAVAWWLKEAEAGRRKMAEAIEHGLPLSTAMVQLSNWVKELEKEYGEIEGVWAHGITFDLPQIYRAYSQTGIKVPWHYTKARDTRTIYSLIGGAPKVAGVGTAHSAVDDCIYQICQLQVAMSAFDK